jgi:predicted ArsR family transcriptional regulator
VDRLPLNATEFASAVTAITSAFGDPTRRDIYLFVHSLPAGVTAADTAAHFELHPNVARHHLDKLAAAGHVEVGTDRRGGAGRPSKIYRPAAEQVAVDIPVKHSDVLVTLLGKALARLGREEAEALAEEVGVEYGRTMARALRDDADTQRSFRSALHVVAEALTANGFAAHAEKKGNELYIVAEHCPFGGAAIEHPVICAVDRGMVKGMLGELYGDSRPEQTSTRPMGDDVCVTAVG